MNTRPQANRSPQLWGFYSSRYPPSTVIPPCSRESTPSSQPPSFMGQVFRCCPIHHTGLYTQAMTTTNAYVGPVDYFVFGFPPDAAIAEGINHLLGSIRGGNIEILDFAVVGRSSDGTAIFESIESLSGIEGFDVSAFDGAQSDILDDDDLDDIAAHLDPGWRALAVVYEERSLASVAEAWDRAGGRLLLAGGIEVDELEDALTRTSSEEGAL